MTNAHTITGFIRFFWSNRINRIMLGVNILLVAVFIAVQRRLSPIPVPWQFNMIAPLVLPASLLLSSALLYRFHVEWANICNAYGDKLDFRKNVRTYIRNAQPWGTKGGLNYLSAPIYDFDYADVLESDDLIIVYGRLGLFSGRFFNFPNTRPFAIHLKDQNERIPMYQVKLISKSETKEAKEYTFKDWNIDSVPITIKIYKD